MSDPDQGRSIVARFSDSGLDVFQFLLSLSDLSPQEQYEVLRADLEHRSASGEAVPLDRYLEVFQAVACDRDLKRLLVSADFVVRSQRGESPDVEEYARRFPDLEEVLREQFSATLIGPASGESDSLSTVNPALDDTGKTAGQRPALAQQFSTSSHERFGDYLIEREIARGGMGVVYKAVQTRLNRTVALKMIKAGDLADLDDIKRFGVEAQAAAKLDHPQIVPIYEVGEIDGRHFFSMGFVDGQGLNDRLKAGPLPSRVAAELVELIAEAVQYAHERGVIHRDLKPANVLLDGEGNPRITDFGLAKQIAGDSGITATGQVIGTPSFMPPEQASGKIEQIGPYSDVYSLGAILYAILTGRPPFQAASVMETLRQVLETEPVAVRLLNPAVEKDLETICLKCLSKEVSKRYQSAQDLADDLDRFLSGHAILARPVGTIEKSWRWCRRNPLGTTVIALLLMIGIGFSWYLKEQAAFDAQENARQQQLVRDRQIADERVQSAVEEARNGFDSLHQVLDDPIQSATFLSNLDLWEAALANVLTPIREAEQIIDTRNELVGSSLKETIHGLRQRWDRESDERVRTRELDDARLKGSLLIDGEFQFDLTRAAYKSIFREKMGLDVEGEKPAALAERIRGMSNRFAIVAALDHWANISLSEEQDAFRSQLLEIADQADAPNYWRHEFRQTLALRKWDKLNELAGSLVPEAQSPQILVTFLLLTETELGRVDPEIGRRIRVAHADDFWVQYLSGLIDDDFVRKTQSLGSAVAIRKDSSVAWYNLGQALYEQGTEESLADDSSENGTRNRLALLDDSIEYYRKAIQLDENFVDAIVSLGAALAEAGRDEEAVAQFYRAIELDENQTLAYLDLGVMHIHHNEPELAVPLFQKAAETSGATSDEKGRAYYYWGSALADQELFPEAIPPLRQAVALDEANADARFELANALTATGSLAEGSKFFAAGVKLDPANPEAHYNFGVSLLQAEEFSRAITQFRRAIEIKQDYLPPYVNLAGILASQGELDEAIAVCKQGLMSFPDNPELHTNWGYILYARQEFTEAITHYEIALRSDNSNAVTYTNLGTARLELGEVGPAIEALKSAIELDPDIPLAQYALGMAYQMQDRDEEAIRPLQTALQLNPDDHRIWEALGKSQLNAGHFQDAEKTWQNFLKQLPLFDSRTVSAGQFLVACRTLIEKEKILESVLSGTTSLEEAKDWYELGYLCQTYKQRYQNAARFYRTAFELDPELVGSLETPRRFLAIGAALRAGFGQGNDGKDTPDDTKSEWRGQAMTWFREELKSLRSTAQEAKPVQREAVRAFLVSWRSNNDLSLIREGELLEKLPEDERRQWAEIWSEHDRLVTELNLE